MNLFEQMDFSGKLLTVNCDTIHLQLQYLIPLCCCFFFLSDDLTELFGRRSRRPVGCGDVSREMMYEYDEDYRAKVTSVGTPPSRV